MSIWKTLKHGLTDKQILQMGHHVLGFLGHTQWLICKYLSNNFDPEFFFFLLQLLHNLSMNTLWDRWCLVEFTFSIWLTLDNVLQYHVWNTRNPFLHPDLIVWILWKPHLSIHRKCLCNEASTISFHKHQFYKHQPLHLKCLLHPCVWYIWWYSVGKKVWCKLFK